MTNLPHRMPPQSLEAEQALLGCALISERSVPTVLAAVREEDFSLEAHRRILGAIRWMFDRKQPVDVLTVPNELQRQGILDQVGGVAYIHTLSERVPTVKHVDFYAKTVCEKSDLRGLIELCRSVSEHAYDEDAEAEELRQRLIVGLLGQKRSGRVGPSKFSDVMGEEITRLALGEAVPVMPLGVAALDRFCGGLEQGDLGIIAGAPGCGKTALLHQLCLNAAEYWGKGLIFSLEINERAVVRRALARVSGHSYRELREAGVRRDGFHERFNEGDVTRIERASRQWDTPGQNLWIDAHSYDLDALIATSHEMHAREGLGFIVVDYAQLVDVRRLSGQKRNVEVEAVTRAAKNRLAVDLNLPVVMVSSLSKEGQKTSSPKLSDLAESAALEYTAALIIYLLTDPTFSETENMRGVTALVAKCRNDRRGPLPLVFHTARFLLTGRDEYHDGEEPPDYYRGGD